MSRDEGSLLTIVLALFAQGLATTHAVAAADESLELSRMTAVNVPQPSPHLSGDSAVARGRWTLDVIVAIA